MTTLRLRACLAITAASVAYAAAAGAELRGRISGDGGKPLARAVVRVVAPPAKPSRVETGDDGTFLVANLSGATFKVRVDAKGYQPLTQSDIPAGASVQLRLKPGKSVSGIVKDRVQGVPLAGATVSAWDKAAEPFGADAYRVVKTGKDGKFVLPDLADGKVALEAKATGRAPRQLASVAVPKSDVEILLDLPGGLTGTVTDVKGDPVAGAEVIAAWPGESGQRRRSAKTEPDGHYRIADVDPAVVSRMAVKSPRFLAADRQGPAPADGVVDFVLERRGSIGGTVRGYDGKALASFTVRARPAKDSKNKDDDGARKGAEKAFTDPSGAFLLEDVDPGTYTVEASADGYATVKKEDVEVLADHDEDLGTLTLGSRAMMRGRVVGARDRAPVPGASIRIELVSSPDKPEASGPSSWSVVAGPDGTFTTPVLPDGTFEVVAEHPRYAPARQRLDFHPDSDGPEVILEMFQGGSLTGTVLDGKLEPVAGVRIVATMGPEGDSRVADTGSDGHYYMDSLTPGTWSVSRQQDKPSGTQTSDTKVALIREGETTTVDFDEKPKVHLTGTVIKGQTPIPGASIYFVAIDNNLPHDGKSAQADAEGRYQVGLLHGGRYQVSVVFGASGGSGNAGNSGSSGGSPRANGHSVITLNIPDLPEVSQDIVFTESAISGHVVDSDGRGIKGALVTALREGTAAGDPARQSTTMTVDGGAFRLEALDPGSYRVTARAKAYSSDEEFPVVVADTEPEPDITLTLQRGWIMRGRLLDPQGKGIPGALVVVAPDGAAESGYLPSQTDQTGAFRVTAPADGPVNVSAIAARYAPAVQTGIEPPGSGDAPEVVLHATAGGSMRIRVVHRNGQPVAGAQLSYQPFPLFPGCDVVMDRNRPQPTGPDGSTLVTLLYPGDYAVSIVGRRDTPSIRVFVNEGSESDAVIEVP
jgi:hypothetical protein